LSTENIPLAMKGIFTGNLFILLGFKVSNGYH
jgi:hypothetical protein